MNGQKEEKGWREKFREAFAEAEDENARLRAEVSSLRFTVSGQDRRIADLRRQLDEERQKRARA